MTKRMTEEDIIKIFGDYGYEVLEIHEVRSRGKVTCIDKDGYKYYTCSNLLKCGRRPEPYNKWNPYTLENVQHFLDIESNGSKLLSKEYIGSRQFLQITCEDCGETVERYWANVMQNKCFKCKDCMESPRKLSLATIEPFFNQRGLTIIDTEYKANNIPINCIDEQGYKIKIAYSNVKKTKKFVIFSVESNKENYIYNVNNYLTMMNMDCVALELTNEKSGDYYKIKCRCACGKEFYKTLLQLKDGSTLCVDCSAYESRLEKKVRKWFEENDIKYIAQKKFDDCKDKRPLPFDFYIEDFNCCVEVDGKQHNMLVPIFGDKESFEKRQLHDEIKTQYCKDNGIDLLRISYKDIERQKVKYKQILSNKFIKE